MPARAAGARNRDPGCGSVGAIQRGKSWVNSPKTLNCVRTVRQYSRGIECTEQFVCEGHRPRAGLETILERQKTQTLGDESDNKPDLVDDVKNETVFKFLNGRATKLTTQMVPLNVCYNCQHLSVVDCLLKDTGSIFLYDVLLSDVGDIC